MESGGEIRDYIPRVQRVQRFQSYVRELHHSSIVETGPGVLVPSIIKSSDRYESHGQYPSRDLPGSHFPC